MLIKLKGGVPILRHKRTTQTLSVIILIVVLLSSIAPSFATGYLKYPDEHNADNRPRANPDIPEAVGLRSIYHLIERKMTDLEHLLEIVEKKVGPHKYYLHALKLESIHGKLESDTYIDWEKVLDDDQIIETRYASFIERYNFTNERRPKLSYSKNIESEYSEILNGLYEKGIINRETSFSYSKPSNSRVQYSIDRDNDYYINNRGNAYAKRDFIRDLMKVIDGVEYGRPLLIFDKYTRPALNGGEVQLDKEPIQGSPYMTEMGKVGIDSALSQIYVDHRQLGSLSVYTTPDVYELYLYKALRSGVIRESEFTDNNPVLAEFTQIEKKDKMYPRWYNQNLPYMRALTPLNRDLSTPGRIPETGVIGGEDFHYTRPEENTNTKQYVEGYKYMQGSQIYGRGFEYSTNNHESFDVNHGKTDFSMKKSNKDNIFFKESKITLMEACQYIYKAMEAWGEPRLTELERDVISSMFSVNYGMVSEEERDVLNYLIAKGIIKGDSKNNHRYNTDRTLTVEEGLGMIYRVLNPDARYTFKHIFTPIDEDMYRKGFVQNKINVTEYDKDIPKIEVAGIQTETSGNLQTADVYISVDRTGDDYRGFALESKIPGNDLKVGLKGSYTDSNGRYWYHYQVSRHYVDQGVMQLRDLYSGRTYNIQSPGFWIMEGNKMSSITNITDSRIREVYEYFNKGNTLSDNTETQRNKIKLPRQIELPRQIKLPSQWDVAKIKLPRLWDVANAEPEKSVEIQHNKYKANSSNQNNEDPDDTQTPDDSGLSEISILLNIDKDIAKDVTYYGKPLFSINGNKYTLGDSEWSDHVEITTPTLSANATAIVVRFKINELNESRALNKLYFRLDKSLNERDRTSEISCYTRITSNVGDTEVTHNLISKEELSRFKVRTVGDSNLVLEHTLTGQRAFLNMEQSVALVGNEVLKFPKGTMFVHSIGDVVFYNMEIIKGLLQHQELTERKGSMTPDISIKTLPQDETEVYLADATALKIDKTYTMNYKNKRYLNISTLSSLANNFIIVESKEGTNPNKILIKFHANQPEGDNTSKDFTLTEYINALRQPDELPKKGTAEYLDYVTNVIVNNALLNYVFDTQGEVYVPDGNVVASITMLTGFGVESSKQDDLNSAYTLFKSFLSEVANVSMSTGVFEHENLTIPDIVRMDTELSSTESPNISIEDFTWLLSRFNLEEYKDTLPEAQKETTQLKYHTNTLSESQRKVSFEGLISSIESEMVPKEYNNINDRTKFYVGGNTNVYHEIDSVPGIETALSLLNSSNYKKEFGIGMAYSSDAKKIFLENHLQYRGVPTGYSPLYTLPQGTNISGGKFKLENKNIVVPLKADGQHYIQDYRMYMGILGTELMEIANIDILYNDINNVTNRGINSKTTNTRIQDKITKFIDETMMSEGSLGSAYRETLKKLPNDIEVKYPKEYYTKGSMNVNSPKKIKKGQVTSETNSYFVYPKTEVKNGKAEVTYKAIGIKITDNGTVISKGMERDLVNVMNSDITTRKNKYYFRPYYLIQKGLLMTNRQTLMFANTGVNTAKRVPMVRDLVNSLIYRMDAYKTEFKYVAELPQNVIIMFPNGTKVLKTSKAQDVDAELRYVDTLDLEPYRETKENVSSINLYSNIISKFDMEFTTSRGNKVNLTNMIGNEAVTLPYLSDLTKLKGYKPLANWVWYKGKKDSDGVRELAQAFLTEHNGYASEASSVGKGTLLRLGHTKKDENESSVITQVKLTPVLKTQERGFEMVDGNKIPVHYVIGMDEPFDFNIIGLDNVVDKFNRDEYEMSRLLQLSLSENLDVFTLSDNKARNLKDRVLTDLNNKSLKYWIYNIAVFLSGLIVLHSILLFGLSIALQMNITTTLIDALYDRDINVVKWIMLGQASSRHEVNPWTLQVRVAMTIILLVMLSPTGGFGLQIIQNLYLGAVELFNITKDFLGSI